MEAHGRLKARQVSHITDNSKTFETGWTCHSDSPLSSAMRRRSDHPKVLLFCYKALPLLRFYDSLNWMWNLRLLMAVRYQWSYLQITMVAFRCGIPSSGPIAKKNPPGPIDSDHLNRGHRFDSGRPKGIANRELCFRGSYNHFALEIALKNIVTLVYGMLEMYYSADRQTLMRTTSLGGRRSTRIAMMSIFSLSGCI